MAIILGIESSGSICSVAVFNGSELIGFRESKDAFSHSELMAPFVNELLEEVGKMPDVVAISGGPGSYTGLRIGASLAKGICSGFQIPLIAIPTLELLLEAFLTGKEVSEDKVLCPMIDARRMEVYCAFFNGKREYLAPTKALIVDDSFAKRFPDQKVILFGDGAAKCGFLPELNERFEILSDIWPSARYLGPLAEIRFGSGVFDDHAYYEPYYLKEFQAGPPKNKI